jgi:hypothetical protein
VSLRLIFYISGHGFGHAARDIEIINALAARADLDVTVRTEVPEWFLRESLRVPVTRIIGAVDSGMVQPDGISLDEDASARNAARFYDGFIARAEREADIIRASAAQLVVGDIPPLASAAAAMASVPSVAVGNFTWDWIYAAYPQFESVAPGTVARIADGYRQTTLALRLPFCGGFSSMPCIDDVPLIARIARLTSDETRRRLGLDREQTIVLASFGGHSGQVALGAVAGQDVTVIAVGDETQAGGPQPGHRTLSSERLRHADVSYTDLLAASDVVLSKVGYGIVADCIANQVPLLYTHRGRFVEQDVFDHELPPVLRCRHLDAATLRAGTWVESVSMLLNQPVPAHAIPVNGADVVAERLLTLVES